MSKKISILDALFVGVLLVIFGGVVLHAPFSVGLTSLFPQHELLIKSWKEVLLGVALVLAAVALTRHKQWSLLKDKFVYVIAAFGILNLLLIPLFNTGFESIIAGLFINLRFLLFFVLVYIAVRLYPRAYRPFMLTFAGGALLVTVFAILQVTVLPNDILKYIGYNESTIMPFLTVDENINYIRINSTLRGPNPLGVYAVIVLAMVVLAWLRTPRKLSTSEQVLGGVLAAGSVVALWASYSRSAALAALLAIGIILFIIYRKSISKAAWIGLAALAIVLTGSLVALRDTQFVSQVILHEDPHEGNDVNSNDGHAESLKYGVNRMIHQPLGAGIGSTGSASLYGDKPLIIENQYLFVAHENGWPGLALFLVIMYFVLRDLWRRRFEGLALAVFASGIGLSVAGLFLPVWADDTVSIVWWGLAAVILALPVVQSKQKVKKARKK